MRNFLHKIIKFIITCLCVITISIVLVTWLIKVNANFKIDPVNQNLILGHSHSECSFNDKLIDSTLNLSHSGESYFYNYQKLKVLIKDNPHIKTVFIEFTNSQIDSTMNQWIWGYDKMSYFLPKYGPFINQEDISLLFKKNTKDFFSSYSIAVRKNLYRIVRNDYDFTDEIGGYNPIQLSKIEKLNQTYLKNNLGPDNHTLSTKNIYYLRKMIDFLRLNDVNVFLIRSPQHVSNPDLANEKLFKKVYSSKFSDVEFLDFNNLSIKNEHYLDFKHLNYFGAIEFSNLFNNLLEQGLLKSKNKQEIINSAIENFNSTNIFEKH